MSTIFPSDSSFFGESSSSGSSTCSSTASISSSSDLFDASTTDEKRGCSNLLSKIACIVPQRFKRSEKVGIAPTKNDCEMGVTTSSNEPFNTTTFHYQQSATRKLAFGGGMPTESFSTIQDEKKARHLSEFYNSSTLSNIAKLFSACVLISALIITVRRILAWNWPY